MGIALVLLAGIATARIISTFTVFSQTTDEPAHLATGMEWIERGTFKWEPLHPPLARVAIALGPYLSGARLTAQESLWKEGNDLLFANGRYLRNLSLARLGVLPFFLLATSLVWYWARARYGDAPAFVATLIFTTTPVLLAHAGLATTDMAITATFTAFLLAYINLLEKPTYSRSVVLGVATAFAILSKFSAFVFMPACGFALFAWLWFLERKSNQKATELQHFRWRRAVGVTALATFLIVWAGYRFSLGSVTDASARPHTTIDHLIGSTGPLHSLAYAFAEAPVIPAPALFRGLAAVHIKESSGQPGYLLGQIRQTGWWYFFPVALAVKTPLPFLILIALGAFYLLRASWREKKWMIGAPVIAAAAILLVSMPSSINIGVRHILPIYPLLAIIAGVGTCRFWANQSSRPIRMFLILALLTWQVTSSLRAHPDYLAYFNELADRHPEKVLIDSDLDWGQDLLRLSDVLREKHIDQVSIAYAGSADLDLHRFDLPPFRTLAPHQPATGWIAISLLRLKVGGLGFPADSFTWLNAYQPVLLVGRSIRLYYVPLPVTHTAHEQAAMNENAPSASPRAGFFLECHCRRVLSVGRSVPSTTATVNDARNFFGPPLPGRDKNQSVAKREGARACTFLAFRRWGIIRRRRLWAKQAS